MSLIEINFEIETEDPELRKKLGDDEIQIEAELNMPLEGKHADELVSTVNKLKTLLETLQQNYGEEAEEEKEKELEKKLKEIDDKKEYVKKKAELEARKKELELEEEDLEKEFQESKAK